MQTGDPVTWHVHPAINSVSEDRVGCWAVAKNWEFISQKSDSE